MRVALAYLAAAWLLIQVAETIFPLFGFSDSTARVIVIVFGIGFIPAVVMTWVFEFTSEGLKLDRDAGRRDRPPVSTKKFDRIVLLLMAAALFYFGFDKFILDPARDQVREEEIAQQVRSDTLIDSFGDRSIAVLPFVNMSDDESNEYFADGISEELLNLLVKIDDLRVISRSSTFALKGQKIDIPAVGRQLNVAHVLEGSVRKAGNQVRITAQLIDARTDTHLWSETYDRTLDDIFAIQDEIATEVVNQLRVTLGLSLSAGLPREQVVSVEAYDHYLRGLQAFNGGTVDGFHRAEEQFEAAIALEPNYADAYYRLARAQMSLDMAQGGNFESMRETARKALDIDPTNGGALTVMSIFSEWDRVEELQMRSRATAMSPGDSFVVLHYGRSLEANFRKFDADIYFQRAIDLDPLNLENQSIYILFNMFRGRLDKAVQIADRIIELNPDFAEAHAAKGLALSNYGGDVVSGILATMDAIEIDPGRQFWQLRVAGNYMALNDLEAARTWIDRASTLDPDSMGLKIATAAYLHLSGSPDQARQLAEQEFEQGGPQFMDSNLMLLVVSDMIASGRLAEAETFLVRHLPGLEEFLEAPAASTPIELSSQPIPTRPAIQLQHVYELMGDEYRANAITDRLRFSGLEGRLAYDFEATPLAYLYEAKKLMRENQPANALLALQTAVALGYRTSNFGFGWQFELLLNPIFEDIRGEPEFQQLISDIETDMSEQRIRLEKALADRL